MAVNLALASIKSTGSSTSRTYGARFAEVTNVLDYGAVGDGKSITDGAITASDATLTSASNPFVAGDVGKTIGVAWCGTGRVTAPGSMTTAAAAGGGMVAGQYRYRMTFVTIHGETEGGTEVTVTTASTNLAAALTSIPLGGTGTIIRRLYRTLVGGATNTEIYCGNIPDNTTTSWTDYISDADMVLRFHPNGIASSPVPTLNRSAAPLVTTIASFTNAGSVELTATATATVTSATVIWGTDDATAIHAARDAAGEDGTVYFPRGNYLASALTFNVAGQSWLGARGATLFRKPGTSALAHMVNVTGVGAGGSIVGLKFDATQHVQTVDVCGINLEDGVSQRGFLIDRCEFTRFIDSNANYGGDVVTYRDYTTIRACYFHDSDSGAVTIKLKNGSNGQSVNGNGTLYTTVSDCTFVNYRYTAINLTGNFTQTPTELQKHKFNAVRNCYFRNCGHLEHLAGQPAGLIGAIEFWYSHFYSTIEGCTITACPTYNALSVVGATFVKLIGNTIELDRYPLTLSSAHWAIELGNGKHYNIVGNTVDGRAPIFNCTQDGVIWTGGASAINVDNVISGNIFSNMNVCLGPQWAQGNVITGNGFYNVLTAAIRADSAETAQNTVGDTINGNTFRNPSTAVGYGIQCGPAAGFGMMKANISGNQFVKFATGIHTGNSANDTIIGTANFFDGCTVTIAGTAINQIWKANFPVSADNDTIALTAHATANATTTAAKITGLDQACGIGSWIFHYYIMYQSSVTSTGVKFSVNHTGTVTGCSYNVRYVDVSATASTGTADQNANAATGQVMGAYTARAKSATASVGPTLGVDTINADMMMIIEGILTVSVAGTLELYHASETANSTQVMSGSSLFLTKTV